MIAQASRIIEPFAWHPEFGRTVATSSIVVPFLGDAVETVFAWPA